MKYRVWCEWQDKYSKQPREGWYRSANPAVAMKFNFINEAQNFVDEVAKRHPHANYQVKEYHEQDIPA